MNKRLKSLAKQAGFYTDQANLSYDIYKENKSYLCCDEGFVEKELDKFAELIILDCIDQMEKCFAGGEKSESQKEVWEKLAAFKAWNAAIKLSRDEIKEHFGIK